MRRANWVGLLTVVLVLPLNLRAEDKPAEPAPQAAAPSEAPPKDAIVLFDGTNLDQWTKADGKSPAEWTLKDGYAEGKPPTSGGHGNDIQTKQKFKDYNLHLEFWLPPTPGKTDEAKAVGAALAKVLKDKGIEQIIFDRNGYLYHGRVKALAEGAREAGLKF